MVPGFMLGLYWRFGCFIFCSGGFAAEDSAGPSARVSLCVLFQVYAVGVIFAITDRYLLEAEHFG